MKEEYRARFSISVLSGLDHEQLAVALLDEVLDFDSYVPSSVTSASNGEVVNEAHFVVRYFEKSTKVVSILRDKDGNFGTLSLRDVVIREASDHDRFFLSSGVEMTPSERVGLYEPFANPESTS